MKLKQLLLPVFLFCISMYGQDNTGTIVADSAVAVPYLQAQTDTVWPAEGVQNPLLLQVHGGTQGFGVDLKYPLSERFSVRAGASYIGGELKNVFSIQNIEADNISSAHFFNGHIWADFKPFKTDAFRIVGGFAYFFEAKGRQEVYPTKDYQLGDLVVTAEDIGELDINVSWKGLAPYLGIGLFHEFPKKRFNVTADLGMYYLPQPESDIRGTNMLYQNEDLEPQLDKNLKDYRWMPVLQLNFNFLLN